MFEKRQSCAALLSAGPVFESQIPTVLFFLRFFGGKFLLIRMVPLHTKKRGASLTVV
jgi:hypothetical protein